MTKAMIETIFGCCGNVTNYVKHGEEPFYAEDSHMLMCSKCNKVDFPDAFRKTRLVYDDLECPVCKKETKQDLNYFDDWSGSIETTCRNCGQKVHHQTE